MTSSSVIRTAGSWLLTILACLLVWFCLMAPNELATLAPAAFVRIPLEALVFVGLVLLLPQRAGRILAVIVGVVLGGLAILKVLDAGFSAALGRPFDPEVDWNYAGSAVDLLGDAIGTTKAHVVAVIAVLLAIALLVLVPLAVLRLTKIVQRHRPVSLRAVIVAAVAWVLFALLGVQVAAGAPVASTSAAVLAANEVGRVYSGIEDQRAFASAVAVDEWRDVPGDQLLTGLKGKDVMLVFVESYGRVAVQDSAFSPAVNALLDEGTQRLKAKGVSAKSGFLTSATYGGISWLAHATLQTGLWVNNQPRYDDVVASDRFNLSSAFKKAGWRTVSVIPSDNLVWPPGTDFYHYDKLYDVNNLAYRGPSFSYATMPDQYTLAAFKRMELDQANRPPLMAELDLVSSHTPWTPLPRMVGWDELGNGSIFNGMPEQGLTPSVVWRDTNHVREMYGKSIEYSMSAVISFVENYHDDNLVLIVLGDHQPAAVVTGHNASHDVPISIISSDPKVMDRISSWGWQDGLRPEPDAPLWPMNAFRDKFLAAYR
ncbi:MAG: hypothetical protein WCP95_07730 [Actinomycetes bacterium]